VLRHMGSAPRITQRRDRRRAHHVTPATTMRAVAIRATLPGLLTHYESGASIPSHWPLTIPGLSHGARCGGVPDESHPGIDIAWPADAGTGIRRRHRHRGRL